MKHLQLSDFRPGDAWLLLRLDAQVQHQTVDIYVYEPIEIFSIAS